MSHTIKRIDNEEIKEIIRNEEEEIKEIKAKGKTKMKVIVPKENKGRYNPRITMDEENRKYKKDCVICKQEKPIESFAVNYKYKGNNSVKFKNKCLDCYKEMSKEYYRNHKEKLLEQLATKYENTKRKKYYVKLNFNSLEELENEFEKAKEQFIKGEIKEVYRNKKNKKGSGGDGGNSGDSGVSINETI
jgi:hypothetical protein